MKVLLRRQHHSLLIGISEGLPIFAGYVPVAVAFGFLAKSIPLSLAETGLFSALVFAGAAQFIAASLLASGAGITGIIITTLLLNSRHLLLSATVASKLSGSRRLMPLAAFGVTDETFAVATARTEPFGTKYLIGLNTTAWLGWQTGTLIGFVAGDLLSSALQSAMGILLYVMFLGILVPQIKKEVGVLAIAASSGAIHWAIQSTDLLPGGWALVVSIIVTVILADAFSRWREKP